MNIIANNGDGFVISDYINEKNSKKIKGYYQCPNCGKYKLSIAKNGRAYNCYACEDTKAIAYALRRNHKPIETQNNIFETSYTDKEVIKESGYKKDSKTRVLISRIKSLFPDIKFNTQDEQIWLRNDTFKNKICNPEHLYIYLSDKYNIDFPKEKTTDVLYTLAKKNQFNPVHEYLEHQRIRFCDRFKNQGIGEALDQAHKNVSNLASLYLGTENPLYDLYLKKWLFAAVGRAYMAGCYCRNVLILKGEQDYGKSTFFSILGGEWFSDSLMEAKNKDELMIAHGNWILEWQELETIWGLKSLGRVKAFISASKDSLRLPYAKAVTEKKRGFVLCGTTNQDRFLTDKTGNSRFWVIPITQEIKLIEWEVNRDYILGAIATIIHFQSTVYPETIKSGKYWKLTKEELKASEINTRKYEEHHPFEDLIDEVIETWDIQDGSGCGWILADKIWEVLDISIKERPKYLNRVTEIMTSRGYISCRKRINKVQKRVWKRKDS